jgi:hypothetical protein
MISLAGLDKAAVLAALYNAAKPQGMGFLQYDPAPMQIEEATALLRVSTYFDYLKGRVMKVDLSRDELDPRLYDRDNGSGAAERAIEAMKRSGPTAPEIEVAHHVNTLESADDTERRLGQKSGVKAPGVYSDGLATPLRDKIDAAREKLRQ